MVIAHSQNWRLRVSKRALYLGLSVGILTGAVAVGGEMMRLFNCINAWVMGTVVFTLAFAVLGSPCRVVATSCSAIVAYLIIIPYTVIHDVHRERWDADDSVPMFFFTFLLLVVLPAISGFVLDSIFPIRHAHNED